MFTILHIIVIFFLKLSSLLISPS